MSLPRLFRTSLATIPGGVPYLHAEAEERWRGLARLVWRTARGAGVGLAWQGNPDYCSTGLRSIDPGPAGPAGWLPGRHVRFVATAGPTVAPKLPMIDMTAELSDFADTAALMQALDLVITVDTSVAHLAGALGRPVWLLNRFNTDWRWLAERSDSPWYPTMRIFRPPAPRDWDSVLAAVRAALEASAA